MAPESTLGPLIVARPAATDHRKGVFALRTTEHEALPTDEDIFRTITRGVHGTAMPPWFVLPEADLPVSGRAYEISSQARHSFYDCLDAALAEREGCALLTADERLFRNLPGHRIVLLSSLP